MGNGLRYSSTAAMPDRIRAMVEAQGKGAPREIATPAAPKGRKYHNKVTRVDGIRFDSKKEASYYAQLKLRIAAGEVTHFFRQVPIHLPDGTKYVLDFLVFFADAGRAPEYVDTKGVLTPVFRMKKKAVEFHYPIKLTLV